MKRTLLLVALVGLFGCSPDEQAHEQAEARTAFADAHEHLSNATAGYIADPEQKFTGTLEQYQLQQLEQASEELTPIVRNGSPDQQVAASMALAAVEAARGRRAAQAAAIDWAKQTAMSKQMIATLTGARKAQTMVDAHNALDTSDQLQSANEALNEARQELREAQATISAKQSEIKRRTDRRTQLEAERQQKAAQAADVRGKAFQSSGQLRFDLHQRAKELSRQADQLGVQADQEAMEISRAKAELAIAEIEKQQADERIESMQSIITSYEKRKEQLGMTLNEAEQLADELATDLVNQLQTRAQEHTQEVADPYTEARNHYGKAVSTLQTARSVADADSRLAVVVDLAGTQSELAFTMRSEAIAHQAFADLLLMIADQTRSGFPKAQAGTIKTMTDDAVNRAAKARTDAVEALNKAAELLKDADDAARGENDVRRIVLKQQVAVLNTLADVTGNESDRQKANGAAAELNELNAD